MSTLYLRFDSNVADQGDGWNKKQAEPETGTTIHIAILNTVKPMNKQVIAANDNKPHQYS